MFQLTVPGGSPPLQERSHRKELEATSQSEQRAVNTCVLTRFLLSHTVQDSLPREGHICGLDTSIDSHANPHNHAQRSIQSRQFFSQEILGCAKLAIKN